MAEENQTELSDEEVLRHMLFALGVPAVLHAAKLDLFSEVERAELVEKMGRQTHLTAGAAAQYRARMAQHRVRVREAEQKRGEREPVEEETNEEEEAPAEDAADEGDAPFEPESPPGEPSD